MRWTVGSTSDEANDASFWLEHWGDVASVAGLVVALVTLLAARGARKAALAARQTVFRLNLVDSIGETLTLVEGVMHLQRNEDWSSAINQYSSILKLLAVTEQLGESYLEQQDQTTLSDIAMQCEDAASVIEGHLVDSRSGASVGKRAKASADSLNAIMRTQSKKLNAIHIKLKSSK